MISRDGLAGKKRRKRRRRRSRRIPVARFSPLDMEAIRLGESQRVLEKSLFGEEKLRMELRMKDLEERIRTGQGMPVEGEKKVGVPASGEVDLFSTPNPTKGKEEGKVSVFSSKKRGEEGRKESIFSKSPTENEKGKELLFQKIRRKPKEKIFELMEALVDFEATSGDEMSFKKGELLEILGHPEDSWWEARIQSEPTRRGLIPVTYCGELLTVTNNFSPETEEDLPLVVGERILVLSKPEEKWWRGRNPAGEEGLFPATFCSSAIGDQAQVDDSDSDSESDSESSSEDEDEVRKKKKFVKVFDIGIKEKGKIEPLTAGDIKGVKKEGESQIAKEMEKEKEEARKKEEESKKQEKLHALEKAQKEKEDLIMMIRLEDEKLRLEEENLKKPLELALSLEEIEKVAVENLRREDAEQARKKERETAEREKTRLVRLNKELSGCDKVVLLKVTGENIINEDEEPFEIPTKRFCPKCKEIIHFRTGINIDIATKYQKCPKCSSEKQAYHFCFGCLTPGTFCSLDPYEACEVATIQQFDVPLIKKKAVKKVIQPKHLKDLLVHKKISEVYDIQFPLSKRSNFFKVIEKGKEKEEGLVVKIFKVANLRKGVQNTLEKDLQRLKIISEGENEYFVKYYDAFLEGENETGAIWVAEENCPCSVEDIIQLGIEYSEEEVSSICFYVLQALSKLGEKGYLPHRNIRPSNIFFAKDGKSIKISSSFVRSLESKDIIREKTSHFLPPELLSRDRVEILNSVVDTWSLGISMITLFQRRPPLSSLSAQRAMNLIPIRDSPKLTNSNQRSEVCLDFLNLCLQKDMKKRKGISDLLNHEFISSSSENRSSILEKLFQRFTKKAQKFGGREKYIKLRETEIDKKDGKKFGIVLSIVEEKPIVEEEIEREICDEEVENELVNSLFELGSRMNDSPVKPKSAVAIEGDFETLFAKNSGHSDDKYAEETLSTSLYNPLFRIFKEDRGNYLPNVPSMRKKERRTYCNVTNIGEDAVREKKKKFTMKDEMKEKQAMKEKSIVKQVIQTEASSKFETPKKGSRKSGRKRGGRTRKRPPRRRGKRPPKRSSRVFKKDNDSILGEDANTMLVGSLKLPIRSTKNEQDLEERSLALNMKIRRTRKIPLSHSKKENFVAEALGRGKTLLDITTGSPSSPITPGTPQKFL